MQINTTNTRFALFLCEMNFTVNCFNEEEGVPNSTKRRWQDLTCSKFLHDDIILPFPNSIGMILYDFIGITKHEINNI